MEIKGTIRSAASPRALAGREAIRKQALGILIVVSGLGVPSRAGAGSWQAVGSLRQARDGASATVLADGTVLVAGGEGPQGADAFSVLRSAERFDPNTNRFQPTGAMKSSRLMHATVSLPDGRVLIVGGTNGNNSPVATVEAYDPATGTFALNGKLAIGRIAPTATLLADGQVLIVGGISGGRLKSAELYDPATGVSTLTGTMAEARVGHSAFALPDGRVLILGGAAGKDGAPGVKSVEIYDPMTGTFSAHGEIGDHGTWPTATLLADGRILVAGGIYQAIRTSPVTALNTEEVYEPQAGQSQTIDPMITPRYWQGAVALREGSVLLLGGCSTWADGPATAAVERVDPASGKVSAEAPMAVPRARPGVALLSDGRVLVFGGFPAWGVAPTTGAQVYVP